MHTEYDFNDKEFEKIRSLVYEKTGIHLDDTKRDLVYSRFSKRMRQLGVKSFCDYYDYVQENEAIEVEHFSNAITTNLTSFFREKHHFEMLENDVIPDLCNKSERRIRIWSAGCSTGEEPYSIAITLLMNIPDIKRWDVKILATDLDSNVVDTAARGIYPVDRLEKLDESIKSRWFHEVKAESHKPQVGIVSKAKSLITFKQLNLMHDWPMKGPFDVIFCRNVVIYFDKSTQKVLFNKFANLQYKDAKLFVGHSENLTKVSNEYEHISRTMYRRL